jgi:hypothetical protein
MKMTARTLVTSSALAIGVAALWAGTALAGQNDGSAPAAPQGKSAKDDSGRKVCRNLVLSGTRLSTRTCRTQAQWDEAALAAQESALQQQTGPGGRPESMRSDEAAAIANRPR